MLFVLANARQTFISSASAAEGTPKSTIASLEALLGVEVPAQPTAPPKPDVPPESPTPKVVVGNPAPEKPPRLSDLFSHPVQYITEIFYVH